MPESEWQTRRDRIDMLATGQTCTAAQQQWLDRIRAHPVENLSINREDFEDLPVFTRYGGRSRADRDFDGKLLPFLRQANEAVSA